MPKGENYPELVKLLSTIGSEGFTQLQAKAYISLLKLDEQTGATGSSIAEDSGINRSKIYDVLNDLEKMGAVKKIPDGRNTKYRAIDPETVFSRLVDTFSTKLTRGKKELEKVVKYQPFMSEEIATHRTIELDKLDLNEYRYLITSDERTRSELLNKMPRDFVLGDKIILLSVNTPAPPNLVMLVKDDQVITFNLPIGRIVDYALTLDGKPFGDFFNGLISSAWDLDLPEEILHGLKSGLLDIVHIGKASSVFHRMPDSIREYSRPVPFVITESLIIFYYEGRKDHSIPIRFMRNLTVRNEIEISAQIINQSGEHIGDLVMVVVNRGHSLRNLLEVLAKH